MRNIKIVLITLSTLLLVPFVVFAAPQGSNSSKPILAANEGKVTVEMNFRNGCPTEAVVSSIEGDGINDGNLRSIESSLNRLECDPEYGCPNGENIEDAFGCHECMTGTGTVDDCEICCDSLSNNIARCYARECGTDP